jgi:hypothetical protein
VVVDFVARRLERLHDAAVVRRRRCSHHHLRSACFSPRLTLSTGLRVGDLFEE